MAANNAQYWARRMKLLEGALADQGFAYVRNLERQFDRAIAQVEKETAAWYQRFADNNGITYAQARKRLGADELKEFHWTVEEYIRYARENALAGAWIKQLENASAKVHISRLDALKLELQQQAERLAGGQLDGIDALARRIYTEGYYRTAFEIQRGVGAGWTLHALNEGAVAKVLARPWTADGETFRDRVWTNKSALLSSVNRHLTQMIIRGEDPRKTIDALAHDMNVSKGKAGRLVMTESAYFSSAAQKDCFNALGVEQFVVVAALDNDTCGLCGDMDGKVFKMSEYAPGLTAPPFHPWCRCCTAPHFEDMQGVGGRAARDGDGSTYSVPRGMTYEAWKETYIFPNSAWDGIIGLTTSDGRTVAKLKDHFLDQAGARAVSVDEAVDAMTHPLHKTDIKLNDRGEPSFQYIGNAATVAYNPDTDTIVTTWRTGSRTRKKYGGKD